VKYERGFVLPMMPAAWKGIAKLVLILLIVTAVGGIVYAVKSYIEARDAAIFAAGESKERAKWQARESEELRRANATIVFLNDRYTALQGQHLNQVNKIVERQFEEKRYAKEAVDRALAAASAGTLILRDPGARAATGQDAGAGEKAQAGAAAAESHGTQDSRLSGAASAFLLQLAGEADAVVLDLARVQDLALAYYNYCAAE